MTPERPITQNQRHIFLASGAEHIVLHSTTNPNIVLKYPNCVNSLILKMLRVNHVGIRDEISEAQSLLDGTSVRIPKTHILPSTRQYVMAQEFIPNDLGADIRGALMQEGVEYLVRKYDSNPSNFAYHDDSVYWLDPTRGRMNRIVDAMGIDSDSFRDIKIRTQSLLRRIGIGKKRF